MVPVNCSVCGKQCRVKTSRYDAPAFNENTFKCGGCNHYLHDTKEHIDMSAARKIKTLAEEYQKYHRKKAVR